MYASNRTSTRQREPVAWHNQFLQMLPIIRRHVKWEFRRLRSEVREDAVQEALANATVAFARLHERGKVEVAYPTVLARYAVAQVRAGRRVGTPMNSRDVFSDVAQRKNGFRIQSLQRASHEPDGPWNEQLVEDKRITPADLAAMRIDFATWLTTLPRQLRRAARVLALGETTNDAARKFRVSPGRISQIRQQLRASWQQFQHDCPPNRRWPAG